MRYWVVGVFKEVRDEFPKVLNKNELIKRIAGVLGSNDPIARALVLRMLAHMSEIIADRLDLHHKIQQRLLGSVEVYEKDAAMDAVEQLCASSQKFATHIIPQLEPLIKNVETPIRSKLKLIRILKYMHGDVKTVKKVTTCT